jgi:hypothetical protein
MQTTSEKVIEILKNKHRLDTRYFFGNSTINKSSIQYAEKIADDLARNWKHSYDKIKRRTSVQRNIRMILSEAQNHRCCYCGFAFSYRDIYDSRGKNNIRTATYEHVINVSDIECSKNQKRKYLDFSNIAIACNLCNSIRAKTTFDAYQFYDWVQNHLDIIQYIADGKIKANRKTMLPYFGKEYCRPGFK